MEKNKGGNPNLSPDVSSLKLKDLGISHNQSSRMAENRGGNAVCLTRTLSRPLLN